MVRKDPTDIYKGDGFHKGGHLINLSDIEQGFVAKWDDMKKIIYLDEGQVISDILSTKTNIIIYIIIIITVIMFIIAGRAYYILLIIIFIVIIIVK